MKKTIFKYNDKKVGDRIWILLETGNPNLASGFSHVILGPFLAAGKTDKKFKFEIRGRDGMMGLRSWESYMDSELLYLSEVGLVGYFTLSSVKL